MKKLFTWGLLALIALVCADATFAQGVNLENFSQGTPGAAPTPTDMGNALYGTLGTCCFVGQTPFTAISNSNSTLTYASATVATDGGPPLTINGITTHSGLFLDYNTTQGNGHSNQIIFLRSPNEVSTITMGSFWFSSTIPVTDSFGTTNDFLQVIGGSSRLANYNSNGTSQNFGIEGCTGPCQGTIPYTPGHTVWVKWQHVQSAGCVNADHRDCVRLAIYDRNLNLIGEEDASVGAGVINYATFGNGNSAALSSGHHMQFSDIFTCWIGCTAAMFDSMMPNNPWLGILSGGHGIDWSQSGISPAANAGTLPDAAWSQCGSTVAAGTSAASVQTLLNACASNTRLILGPGTFTWTSAVSLPTSGNHAISGSGSNSTFIVMTGSSGCPGQISAAFCMSSSDHNYTTLPPATIYNWTAGYTQGTNKMTLSSVAGIVAGTLLFSDQCDTGSTGAPCSGTVTDNGQYFVCGAQWSSPNGCSMDGPDTGGMRTSRNQLEAHTAVSVAGSIVTVTPPISNPNFVSGQTPQVYVVQPLVNSGVENLSIDLTNASAPTGCVDVFNASKSWISGVRCLNNKRAAINLFQAVNFLVQSSYFFKSTGSLPSNYGIRASASSYIDIQNNIFTQIQGGEIFYDGACVGCVSAYNYAPDSNTNGGSLTPFTEHSGDQLNLWEGNVGPGVSCDNIHGTCNNSARFRNHWRGWDSVPGNPVASFTNGTADFAFARYIADVANVQGTPGRHTSYTSPTSNTAVYNEGTGGGSTSVPVDPLTKSTTLKWGGYDNVTGAVRWCGNALNTGWATALPGCASLPENNPAASTYPVFVPVIGDTGKGQPALPASFYLTSKPAWFQSITFPPIGPDVSGGNVIQCGGSLNTVGKFNGVPAINTSANCTAGGTGWAGHVNANPAMACYLNTMAGNPDGSSAVLPFDAGACYGGTAAPIASFSPTSTNMGQVPSGLTSNLSPVVTLTNTGTANLVVSTISLGSAVFSMVNNTCGSPATITNTIPGTGFTLTPSTSCTFQITYSPVTPNFTNAVSIFFSPGASNPDLYNLSGTSTGQPAPATTMFAGIQVQNGVAKR